MTENRIKANLAKKIKERFPAFMVYVPNDRLRDGIPDIEVTGRKLTTWYELKYADPKFDAPGQQLLTMKRLNHAGHASRYLIFTDDRQLAIIPPHCLDDWREHLEPIKSLSDFERVLETIDRLHGGPL